MELKIKTHHALPCRTEVFTINGKDAEQNDFGDTYDHHHEDAEPYACADMHFDLKPPTKEVLNRYNITDKEYYDICNELECELCVWSLWMVCLIDFRINNISNDKGRNIGKGIRF